MDKSRKFGLIGKKLEHSFSPSFFKNYFELYSINGSYETIEIPELSEVVLAPIFSEYEGLNVTIPYKETIIPFLDELSPEAKEIGAVNTIRIQNGQTIGYNTDAFGFHQSIKPFLTNRHERALILGTGGAAKAIAYTLEKIGISCIFLSRNPSKENEFPYETCNEYMLQACKLIVNCTPIGMFPHIDEKPPVQLRGIDSEHLIVDLIYNPEKTIFLSEAENLGATILNGHSMLKEQALKAWDIWK